MAAGKLMDKLEGRFDRYLDALLPLLLAALKNAAGDYQLCAAAVGACGDLCRAVDLKMAPYCDPVVQALLEVGCARLDARGGVKEREREREREKESGRVFGC
jgi:hypothetical protein